MNFKRCLIQILSRLKLLSFTLSVYQSFVNSKLLRPHKYEIGLMTLTRPKTKKKLLFDVSSLAVRDHGGGIQRFQKSLMILWESNPPSSFEVIPIYYSEIEGEFKYYKGYLETTRDNNSFQANNKVEIAKGDVYLNSDLNYQFVIQNPEFFPFLIKSNVEIYFVMYDLLPLSMPDSFPLGIKELHQKWIEIASDFVFYICISKTVQKELVDWGACRGKQISSAVVYLGSDISKVVEPDFKTSKINNDASGVNFLVVNTIEPRKSHELVLNAFEVLWDEGNDVSLTFVGKEGWKVEKLVERMRTHPKMNVKLFWHSNLSDTELTDYYKSAHVIINASVGEGFGLPIVEASSHGMPLILRDIPIFREIAGTEAWYFSTDSADELAQSLRDWVSKFKLGEISEPKNIKVVTWQDTGNRIIELINNKNSKRLS
jgi:glycosyltransferase involved in cell wall biosynthesis